MLSKRSNKKNYKGSNWLKILTLKLGLICMQIMFKSGNVQDYEMIEF